MQDLKKSIKESWRKVNQNKELCRRLMNLFLSGYLLSLQMMAIKSTKMTTENLSFIINVNPSACKPVIFIVQSLQVCKLKNVVNTYADMM